MTIPHPRFLRVGLAALAAAALARGLAGCDTGPGGDGQIRVSTDPPEAAITCNGVAAEASPTTITRLLPGTYLIVAEKPGYQPARKSVSILEGGRGSVDLKLEPAFGLVLVDSKPQGADVHVDGAFRGRTPFFMTDLVPGTHRFAFSLAGHLNREVEEIVADRVPRKVLAELPTNAGKLMVRSTPPGAAVRLNGVDRGKTPLEITDAPSGENTVEILMDGYKPLTEKVAVQAQETKEVAGVLQAIPTTLQIVSIPPGARIYVNNQFRGEAPVTLTDLPPGEQRLRAELAGFETAARSVSLLQQSAVVEEFRMQKNSGKIVVVSDPPGAKVFLNGEERGVTVAPATGLVSEPFEIDLLPPGAYTIQLHRTGYGHTPKSITVAPNAVVDLHEKMVRRFVPDTRIRMRMESGGEIVREGMMLRKMPDGTIELQLDTGTIMKIPQAQVVAIEPLKAGPN